MYPFLEKKDAMKVLGGLKNVEKLEMEGGSEGYVEGIERRVMRGFKEPRIGEGELVMLDEEVM